MRNSIVLFSCIVLLLTACSKSSGDTNNTNNNNGGGTTAGPMFTSVKAVMQTNCAVAGCHAGASPQNGINFNDNATIVAQKDRIKIRAVDQAGTANQMPQPPRAALSAGDQKTITDWIAAGGTLGN